MVSRTVIPAAMIKSGDGKQYFREQMMPDYACCDDPGYFFISSPLNVYPIGRSGSLVLYVEGGCPPFTWAASGSWATFGTAETSVRYNTLGSGAGVGADVTVTVTDLCSEEVTISVPWTGAATCCEDPPAFSMQTPMDEITGWPGEVVVFLDGGCPAFTWTISGTGFTLDYAETNSRRNRVHGNAGAIGLTIAVEDSCGQTACQSPGMHISAPCGFIETGEALTVTLKYGTAPITWEWVGSHTGWTLAEAETADLDVIVTVASGPTDKCVTLKATDFCEASTTAVLGVNDVDEFDSVRGQHPSVRMTVSGILAVCYEGPDADGWTKSYSVDSCGQLTAVDSIEHNTTTGGHHQTCTVWDGTVLCTVYQQANTYLGISSMLIDGSGNLSQLGAGAGYLQYSNGAGSVYYGLCARDPAKGVIVSAYGGQNGYVWATSMQVLATSAVTDPVTQSIQLTSTACQYPDCAMVGNDAFFVAWQDATSKLSGRTVSLSDAGAMQVISAETQFTAFAAAEFQVLKVKDGWVLILCRNATNVGYIVALEVTTAGAVTIPDDSVYAFTDTNLGLRPSGYILDENHIAISTYDNSFGLHFWVYEMQLDAGISWTLLEHYDYGADVRQLWSMDKVSDNTLVMGYFSDAGNFGRIRTRKVCY